MRDWTDIQAVIIYSRGVGVNESKRTHVVAREKERKRLNFNLFLFLKKSTTLSRLILKN